MVIYTLLLATITAPASIELIDPKTAVIIEEQKAVIAPATPQPQERVTKDAKELVYE